MNTAPTTRWHVCPSTATLAELAAHWILRLAAQAIAKRGRFSIVLAGGTSPLAAYARLRDSGADWSDWWVYFGDERCVAASDSARNSLQAWQHWLGPAQLPPQQIFPIPAELGPDTAASRYALLIDAVGTFDLVVLGLGEDGHCASLFPGHEWGTDPDAAAVLSVHNAPKPPANRVSLSARRLADCRRMLFLIAGSGKREALRAWRGGATLPAAAMRCTSGIDVLVEKLVW